MSQKNDPSSGVGTTLVLTRTFDAPRSIVFGAWIDRAHLERWWGPEGFTNPVCEADARPGGAIRIDMRAPDGTVYPMGGKFLEIEAPSRIVFMTAALDGAGNPLLLIRNTVTFAGKGAGTLVRLEARVEEAGAAALQFLKGMEAGWTQSLERLSGHLSAGSDTILIQRTFDAPRDLVWNAWRDPAQLSRWWGPTGFTTTVGKMDLRPGGEWILVMHGPDGTDYPNVSVFTEVAAPERVVFTLRGGKKGEPEITFVSTWTFEALGARTRVTIRMVFPTAGARDRVVGAHGAVEGGYQTLERLRGQIAASG